jgi:hypothetical protein
VTRPASGKRPTDWLSAINALVDLQSPDFTLPDLAGHTGAAITHFKRAHALKPDNWNYKRQALNLGDIERDYGTRIMDEVRGPIPFYPPLDLPDPE